MADFKKPFKAVPLGSKRLKGLDEFDRPHSSFRPDGPPINGFRSPLASLLGFALGLPWFSGARETGAFALGNRRKRKALSYFANPPHFWIDFALMIGYRLGSPAHDRRGDRKWRDLRSLL